MAGGTGLEIRPKRSLQAGAQFARMGASPPNGPFVADGLVVELPTRNSGGLGWVQARPAKSDTLSRLVLCGALLTPQVNPGSRYRCGKGA